MINTAVHSPPTSSSEGPGMLCARGGEAWAAWGCPCPSSACSTTAAVPELRDCPVLGSASLVWRQFSVAWGSFPLEIFEPSWCSDGQSSRRSVGSLTPCFRRRKQTAGTENEQWWQRVSRSQAFEIWLFERVVGMHMWPQCCDAVQTRKCLVLCSHKCLFWAEQDEEESTNLFSCLLVIPFVLVPESSLTDLITNSINANLLTKFNKAVTQQKVLEKYFQCFANVESRKPEHTWKENQSYNNFTCAFLCLFLSLWSWDPPSGSALRLWGEKM